ncbi:hypothetical protein OG876_01385 [Kribbella sp. NBC_00359]
MTITKSGCRIEAGDDRVVAIYGAVAAEDLDRDERNLFRDAVLSAPDDAGIKGAVAIAVIGVGVVVDRVVAHLDSAVDVGVVADAGVDDVGVNAGAG